MREAVPGDSTTKAAVSGGLHDEGGSIRSQGGEPGLETGGNSDSGGPDDGMAGGSASGGGKDEPDEGGGPDVNGSAGGTGGANGLRAR